MGSDVGLALGLTLLAGLATAVGSAIAFFAKGGDRRFLSVATGFSAGVMLYVSFVEILPKGGAGLADRFGEKAGAWLNAAAFFLGMALIAVIDQLVPSGHNPHETHTEPKPWQPSQKALLRTGIFTALAVTIHNFPEGLATFLATLQDPKVGGAIALAVALHNIPEGVSVSVPVLVATGSRRKAFLYSALSGLAEPIGALAALAGLAMFHRGEGPLVPPELLGFSFGAVAGIMVYISLDELLPTSRAYGRGHDSLLGLMAGMVAMAVSLLLLA
ncbi:MAG: zinc transporter ZupT [Fimbriimonadales bacterium]|nr:zinc transporter ZupT [Fimbriimonadales bacterium]